MRTGTSTNCSITGGYIKAGRIATLSMNITVTQAIASGVNIILVSGIPSSASEYTKVICVNINDSINVPSETFVRGTTIMAHLPTGHLLVLGMG